MKFIKKIENQEPMQENVFSVVQKCKEDNDKNKVNATIGMLYDESGQLVTLKTVYETFDKIDWKDKARYAEGILGDKEFIKTIENWYFKHVNINYSTLVTIGGTGAVASCLDNFSQPNDYVILPNVTWDPYYVIINDHKLNYLNFEMIVDNKFNLDGIKACINKIKDKQKNIILIINDPCHNPTGYSMTYNEWKELISYANSLKDNNIIILNDVAYIDFANAKDPTKYFETFNDINDNVLIAVATSFSKAMTAYGMRLGALTVVYKNKDHKAEIEEGFKVTARGNWSNPNNGAMKCFNEVLKQPQAYLEEKQKYIDLINKRAQLFLKYAKEYELPIYKYVEGFFITIKVEPEILDRFHEALMKHHIYTIKIVGGIRITICSLRLDQIEHTVKTAATLLKELKRG